jgi:hypothetical protein
MTSELGIIVELASLSGMDILNTTSLEEVVIIREMFLIVLISSLGVTEGCTPIHIR